VTLSYGGTNTLELSALTGLPTNTSGIATNFIPASSTGAMKILYSDSSNTPIFTTEFIPPEGMKTLVAPLTTTPS
jgi:hypothetical protein